MMPDGNEEQRGTPERLKDLEQRTTTNEKRIKETRGWVIGLMFVLLAGFMGLAGGVVLLYLASLGD